MNNVSSLQLGTTRLVCQPTFVGFFKPLQYEMLSDFLMLVSFSEVSGFCKLVLV